MSVKKSTTKRTATTKPEKQEAGYEALVATDIQNLLSNPFTPEKIRAALRDTLADLECEMPAEETSFKAPYIESVLNWHRGFGFRFFGQYQEDALRDGYKAVRLRNSPSCRQPKKGSQR